MFLCIPREILPPISKKIKQKEDLWEIKEENILYICIYNFSELMRLYSTKTKQNIKRSLELLTLESNEMTEDTRKLHQVFPTFNKINNGTETIYVLSSLSTKARQNSL
jgi:hypothetical protein